MRVQNGQTVKWNGDAGINTEFLDPNLRYIVTEHWSNYDWCSLEEFPNFGYPRNIFVASFVIMEDVEVGVM